MDILPNLRAYRILIVEDDLAIAERVVLLLREAGYDVANAYNCGDAVAADHDRFALALVDSAMQDRDGRSIFEYIKGHSTFSRMPIVTIDVGGEATHKYDENDLLNRIRSSLADRTKRKADPGTGSLAVAPSPAPALPAQSPDTGSLRRIRPATAPGPEVDEVPTEPMSRPAFDARLQQQLAALKTLSALGRSISSVLDLNAVLNQIVDAATTLTHAEEGLILLPDEEDKALYLRAMRGIDDASARNFRIRNEDSLVGSVYKTGQPVIVGDQGPLRVKTEYFVQSLLYVPMVFKGRTIGVLGVNNRRSERMFNTHDQELLLDLAAHAAIAIENARLYENSLLQNRQLSTLFEAGMAVNSTLALNAVLSNICQQIIRALDVHNCLISQQDAAGVLRPLASAWQACWKPHQGPTITLYDRPVLKQALSQNAFYIVKRDQAGDKLRPETRRLLDDGAVRMLMLPVRPGSQPAIGSLELFYRGSLPDITPDFRASVRNIAVEISALVTERPTRTPPEVFTKARQMMEMAQANWLILSLLSSQEQLTRILDYGAAVYLEEPYPQRFVSPPSTPLFVDPSPLSYHAREEALPDFVRTELANFGAQAMLCLPLFVRGKLFGMVSIFDSMEARRFRRDEISLAQALASQAATAIENARLYRDLERSLTELKHAQASLVQAARLSAVGELASVVAHQINNPLTTVMADSEIILQDLAHDHPMREGITAINRAGQRAYTVVKRLLSNARRGAPDEEPRWVDVNETIRNTLDLVTTHIERAQITLKIELDAAKPSYVEVLPGHLEDVWLNMLLNARDALATTPNARVTIASWRSEDGRTLKVAVEDNGPGIPPELHKQIFDPFFTTKPAGQGTGLGLYICKQVIERCKGTIQVESSPTKGTSFLVSLPITSSIP